MKNIHTEECPERVRMIMKAGSAAYFALKELFQEDSFDGILNSLCLAQTILLQDYVNVEDRKAMIQFIFHMLTQNMDAEIEIGE